jgi:hypothetical protein
VEKEVSGAKWCGLIPRTFPAQHHAKKHPNGSILSFSARESAGPSDEVASMAVPPNFRVPVRHRPGRYRVTGRGDVHQLADLWSSRNYRIFCDSARGLSILSVSATSYLKKPLQQQRQTVRPTEEIASPLSRIGGIATMRF